MATIAYCMPSPGEVIIKVHNQTGRLVDTLRETKSAGPQTSQISVGRFASGTYYYVITLRYDHQSPEASGFLGTVETRAPHKFVVLQ